MECGRHAIDVSNRDKLFFPASGRTKGDLIDYYCRIADTMLRYMRDRPLTMRRFPDGIDGDGVYQKRAPDYFPDWIRRARVPMRGGHITHLVCEQKSTLVYLADQGCITPHLSLSRLDKPDHPDQMIFDLDPPDADFAPVRAAALAVRDLLEELDLLPFVKTTGSRGLHVVVPLDRSADFDFVHGFAQDAAALVAGRHPAQFTTEIRKKARRGRLFLDTQRNAYGQTAVAPYAVRARQAGPVATPIDWAELTNGSVHAQTYNLDNIFRRLGQKNDPWRGMARHARALRRPRQALGRLLEKAKAGEH